MGEWLKTREELYKLVPAGADIAELGVEWGYNAAIMQWIIRPNSFLLIDSYKQWTHNEPTDAEQEAIYQFAVVRAGGRLLRASTHDAAGMIDDTFDFVYLDACHCYDAVKRDIADWWPKVRPGGMLAGHDYLGEVEAAVNSMFPNGLSYLTQEQYPSWAVVKQ